MFALRKKQIDPVVLAEVAGFPTARVPLQLVKPKKQGSYEEVARSLGFIPAELTRAQLLEFFEDKSIKLYDYAQVCAWMTMKKVEAKAENWCWRALREKDIIAGYQWGYNNEKHSWNGGFYNSESWQCRLYDRLVPLHALEKVAKIEAKFGDRVKFLISDYTAPDADPFIMVRPAMCHSGTQAEYNLIFDMWDEPGFGV